MIGVTRPARTRDRQRAATEAAILDAAWALIAASGPDGASLRAVARRAGCTHALVVNHFGSKDGLVDAITDRLTSRVIAAVEHTLAGSDDPLEELLAAARRHRHCTQLLIRCALGDLQPTAEWFPVDRILTMAPAATRSPGDDRRARLCSYGAASLALGWLTFDGFLVAATGLDPSDRIEHDLAIAAAAREILDAANAPDPRLARRPLAPDVPIGQASPGADLAPREALLAAAVELFAAHGPASVSVRRIARHASVNHGLVHRHFGSKEALLTEAIEVGSTPVFPAALATEGFDVDGVVHIAHQRPETARLIARTLVDGVDITTVRQQFPVIRQLLAQQTGRLTTTATNTATTGPASHGDPRLAVASAGSMVLGSVIWGGLLGAAFGLDDPAEVRAAVADLARLLLDLSEMAQR